MGSRSANTTSSTRTFQSPKAPSEVPPKLPRQKRVIKTPQLKSLPWLLIILLTAFGAFMLVQYHQAQQKLQVSSNAVAQKHQVDDVVAKVGKLIILPTDEKPSTSATVYHADKLRSQAFFANAKDGDKLLVYNHHKQAILYRPSTNQLVNVQPVTIGTGAPSQ